MILVPGQDAGFVPVVIADIGQTKRVDDSRAVFEAFRIDAGRVAEHDRYGTVDLRHHVQHDYASCSERSRDHALAAKPVRQQVPQQLGRCHSFCGPRVSVER